MIIMDPRGGSWVGELYQKFEAMCAEVEEVMSEDTLKYVENQVRTVGKTVKKFYSDVIQDLHQPSSLDTVKSGDPLMTVIHQGDSDGVICRNPKVDDKTKSVDAIPEKMVNNVNGAAARDDSMYNGYCDSAICSVIKSCEPTSNKSPRDNKCTKVNSRIRGTKSALSNQSTHVVKILDCRQDFQNKCLSSSPSINPTVINNTDEEITFIASHNESDKPSSVHRDASSEEASKVSDNENVAVSGDIIEGYEGGDAINEKEMRVLSGEHFSTDLGISPKKADAAGLSAIITSTKEKSLKFDEEVSISHRETLLSFGSSEFKECDADKQNVLIGEQLNLVKLGDSCVLVEMNDNSAKYAPDHIQKSYKKKIQDVFSPRRWTKGKREQEQFAVWYEDQRGKNFASSTMHTDIQKSQVSESFESDWELL